MNYDFDAATNRRHTNSVKWDSRSDIPADTIPLWVADMDFKAAPAILDALKRRVEIGIFGYTHVPADYYRAINQWFETWHGWLIARDQVIYTSGVVPAISAIVKAMAAPGEKVLMQTPVYNCFFSSVRNNGCIPSENKLRIVGDSFEMDFDDLEARAADPDCHLLLLCNPHNPAGRVWTRAELEKVDDICRRHGVLVVSDEIHCELVYDPYQYLPFATVAKGDWIACVSPSKAFNIAGLQIANIVCSNAEIYAKVDRAINVNEVCEVNPFGVDALIAAYDHGRPWLEALLPYLYDNYLLLRQKLQPYPQFKLMRLEGTYLAWVDCRAIGLPSEEIEERLIADAHVWVNAGSMYGRDGEGFIRINLACQRQKLEKALDQMLPALASYLPKA